MGYLLQGSTASAHLLVEDRLSLPTETRLLPVISPLACRQQLSGRSISPWCQRAWRAGTHLVHTGWPCQSCTVSPCARCASCSSCPCRKHAWSLARSPAQGAKLCAQPGVGSIRQLQTHRQLTCVGEEQRAQDQRVMSTHHPGDLPGPRRTPAIDRSTQAEPDPMQVMLLLLYQPLPPKYCVGIFARGIRCAPVT